MLQILKNSSRNLNKVAIFGANSNIGQPLSLLLADNEKVSNLHLFDSSKVKDLAEDLNASLGKTSEKVKAFYGPGMIGEALDGVDVVVCLAPTAPSASTDSDIENAEDQGESQADISANGNIIASISEAVSEFSPNAWLAILSNQNSSMIPIADSIFKKFNNKNEKIVGIGENHNPRQIFSSAKSAAEFVDSVLKAGESKNETAALKNVFIRYGQGQYDFGKVDLDLKDGEASLSLIDDSQDDQKNIEQGQKFAKEYFTQEWDCYVSGQNLPIKDILSSDPYFHFYVEKSDGQSASESASKSSKTIRKSKFKNKSLYISETIPCQLNPNFKSFKLSSKDVILEENPKIKVQLYDSNFFFTDVFIGQGYFMFNELVERGEKVLKLVDREDNDAGQLTVRLNG